MSKREWWVAVAILLVAAALRLWGLGSLPPGLYRDEAFNGLDALGLLKGDLSLYFAANNGREPAFFYLLAASIGALGRSSFALRLPAACASLLTVPALYVMARQLWGRRAGLLSAAVLALTLWPVHLAHVSFRAVLLPPCLALATWQAVRGWKTGDEWHWLAAGGLYGLSFYTYLAARFTPLALGLFALYAWVAFLRRDAGLCRRALKGAGFFALAAGLTLLPLALFSLFHWDVVMGRVGQASLFNPAINGGDLPGALAGSTLKALGMFFLQGDRIYRHNVPWRPVFDPVLGACFAAGIILAAWRSLRKRDAGTALALAWLAVMLLPTILAEDCPHFLRAAGVLPLVAIFPALALEALWTLPNSLSLRERAGVRGYAALLVALALLFGLSSTVYDYFARYPYDPKTAYWFDSAGVSMAHEARDVLDAGGRAMVDARLWDTWANLRFLVPEKRVTRFDLDRLPAPVPAPVLWLTWPYDDWSRLWALLPPGAQIQAGEGARYQGDRDAEPHTAYLYFRAMPYTAQPQVRAQFEGGVQLLEAGAQAAGERVRVRLVWSAQAAPTQPFVVFVHLLQNGQRVAQADSPPAGGYYPAQAWRAGDVILDEHWLDGPDLRGDEQVMLGLYIPDTGRRLGVLDAAGAPAADSIVLTIGE